MSKRATLGSFQDLGKQVQQFAKDRDWDQFHTPKNLSMAISVECAELMEHFQWLTENQSRSLGPKQRREVAMELADIQIYLIRLSQVLGVDLVAAGHRKLVENASKYPVERARGSARKYTELN